MKKTVWVLFLSMLFSIVGAHKNEVFAADKMQQKINQHVTWIQEYDEFDHIYYDYARKRLNRKVPVLFLNLARDYRRDLFLFSKTEVWDSPDEKYNEKLKELQRQYVITMAESSVISQYKSRPQMPRYRIEKDGAYETYEALAYEWVADRISSQHAKMYLEQAKNFRESIFKHEIDTAEKYAMLRLVLDKQSHFEWDILDQMTKEERALIEEFLHRTVAVNKKEYTIPLNVFLSNYRKTLPEERQKKYPVVHYK